MVASGLTHIELPVVGPLTATIQRPISAMVETVWPHKTTLYTPNAVVKGGPPTWLEPFATIMLALVLGAGVGMAVGQVFSLLRIRWSG